MAIKIIQRSSDEHYVVAKVDFMERTEYRSQDGYWWHGDYAHKARWYSSYDEALAVYDKLVHPPKAPVITYTIVHPKPWWKKLLNILQKNPTEDK